MLPIFSRQRADAKLVESHASLDVVGELSRARTHLNNAEGRPLIQFDPHHEQEATKNTGKVRRERHWISRVVRELLRPKGAYFDLAIFRPEDVPCGVVAKITAILRICVELIHGIKLLCSRNPKKRIDPALRRALAETAMVIGEHARPASRVAAWPKRFVAAIFSVEGVTTIPTICIWTALIETIYAIPAFSMSVGVTFATLPHFPIFRPTDIFRYVWQVQIPIAVFLAILSWSRRVGFRRVGRRKQDTSSNKSATSHHKGALGRDG